MAWLRLRDFQPSRLLRGKRAELLARHLLQDKGYHIDALNVRYPVGEIDIVAHQAATLCFIEVRSTSSSQWGGPLASITDRKRKRLIRAAEWYLRYAEQHPEEIRFDVVAIDWSSATPRLELVQEAFTADLH
jgi:putative endonuclease